MQNSSTSTQVQQQHFKDLLDSDEYIVIVAVQKRIGFGGALINPETVVLTNKRLIISAKRELGLRQSYKFIPFLNIVSVKMERGLTSNAIEISIMIYNASEVLQRIDGLRYDDALAIFNYIDKEIMVHEAKSKGLEGIQAAQNKSIGAYIYCKVCGARNDITAKYCWNCGAKL